MIHQRLHDHHPNQCKLLLLRVILRLVNKGCKKDKELMRKPADIPALPDIKMHGSTIKNSVEDTTTDKHLDWQQRLDIIQGVAEGLCYLHEESETRIIHRDIKASNILMDEKFRPRITDFGLARSFSEGQTHLSTGIAGTRGYMAPEYVVHGRLTVKADVYSFGILIHEIVTGKRCSSEQGSHAEKFLLAEIWHHYKSKTLDRIIDEHLSEAPKEEILHVVQAGLLCTQADPRQRPTMSRVVEYLRSSRRDEELVLTDPAFLDDAMVGFQHLSGNSAADISTSSYLSGR